MKPSLLRAAFFATGICAAGLAQAQASTYQFIDLGSGSAAALNDNGQVVGTSSLGATLWNSGKAVALSPGDGGYASGINDAGQIVGALVFHGLPTAAQWNGSTLTSLASAPGFTYANAINNSGQIVGGSSGNALSWSNAAATAAINLTVGNGDVGISANGINSKGVIVGNGQNTNGATVAMEWNGSTSGTVLASLGGNYSNAYAVNNGGEIVGAANLPSNNSDFVATVWQGSHVTELQSLGGTQSYAYAVNDLGQVVGSSTNAAGTAFATLWNGNTAVNLNSLLNPAAVQAGWVLESATGINDKGWIVGDAVNSKTGASDAFELAVTPVPEPQTYAMLLAGMGMMLGLMKFKSRRARTVQT